MYGSQNSTFVVSLDRAVSGLIGAAFGPPRRPCIPKHFHAVGWHTSGNVGGGGTWAHPFKKVLCFGLSLTLFAEIALYICGSVPHNFPVNTGSVTDNRTCSAVGGVFDFLDRPIDLSQCGVPGNVMAYSAARPIAETPSTCGKPCSICCAEKNKIGQANQVKIEYGYQQADSQEITSEYHTLEISR